MEQMVRTLRGGNDPLIILERLEAAETEAKRAHAVVFDPALNPTLGFELSRAERLQVPCDLEPIQLAYRRAFTTAATDTLAMVKVCCQPQSQD